MVSPYSVWYARFLLLFSASAATDTGSKSFDCALELTLDAARDIRRSGKWLLLTNVCTIPIITVNSFIMFIICITAIIVIIQFYTNYLCVARWGAQNEPPPLFADDVPVISM